MKSLIVIIIGLALLFSACTSAPQEQNNELPTTPDILPEEPVLPAEDETEDVVPTESDTKKVESGLDKVFGEPDDTKVITAEDILCDAETKTVTFRFRNLDEKTWQLDQQLPFPPPSNMAGVRISLNNYEVNGKTTALVEGIPQFRGEGELFSETCESTAELESGYEITCTISPVPLKQSTSFTEGVNEIRIIGPGANGVAQFTCSE